MQRLKVPPSINQFAKALDKNAATELFKLLVAYQPETRAAKADRLKSVAAAQAAGETSKTDKPVVLKYGLKHVTTLVETKKAQLVCIASDVVPLELVVWLPALCRKMGVPYCIVKNKVRACLLLLLLLLLQLLLLALVASKVVCVLLRSTSNSASTRSTLMPLALEPFLRVSCASKSTQPSTAIATAIATTATVGSPGSSCAQEERSSSGPDWRAQGGQRQAGDPEDQLQGCIQHWLCAQVGRRHHGPQDPEEAGEARQGYRCRGCQEGS
eukprot:7891-Heterococcus_DN1.PRE.1